MEGDNPSISREEIYNISIHSLRMEGDKIHNRTFPRFPHFNPLPPHGGRLHFRCSSPAVRLFQSTPSAWWETALNIGFPQCSHISIHSLRMEGDRRTIHDIYTLHHFNPLPPHGGRHAAELSSHLQLIFQSTPSAWRETNFAA